MRFLSNFHSIQDQVWRLCGLKPSKNCTLVVTEAVRSLTKGETRLLPHNLGPYFFIDSNHLLLIQNNRFCHGCKYLPYMWEYQACQHSERDITLSIVPTAEMTDDIKAQMLVHLQGLLGNKVKLTIELVESLPYNSVSEKRPTIVSHLSGQKSKGG